MAARVIVLGKGTRLWTSAGYNLNGRVVLPHRQYRMAEQQLRPTINKLRGSEIFGDFVPVDHVPDRFQIIRALILVFQ